jgi:flagellar hook-associated protein 3 FlgL
MRVSTVHMFQQGLDAIVDRQSKLLKTQLQLSSGKRVNNPSDDPAGAARILDLQQGAAITRQYQANILAGQSRLELEDAVLASVTNSLQRARELAVGGLNGTQSIEDRTAMAKEIRQITDEVMALANTKDANGDYLFSGFQTQTAPFSTNGSGTYTYSGDQGQRFLQVGPTRQVSVGDSGMAVFMKIPDGAGTGFQDVFTSLYNLATDLEANTPNSRSLTELDNAIENILGVRAQAGARLNAIDREREVNDSMLFELEQARSAVEDIDFAEAASRLSRQSLVLEAAQQSFIRVQNLSLFSFL